MIYEGGNLILTFVDWCDRSVPVTFRDVCRFDGRMNLTSTLTESLTMAFALFVNRVGYRIVLLPIANTYVYTLAIVVGDWTLRVSRLN